MTLRIGLKKGLMNAKPTRLRRNAARCCLGRQNEDDDDGDDDNDEVDDDDENYEDDDENLDKRELTE